MQLTLARGGSVPDEAAIDAVWGERPPDSVASALRVHLSTLRAGLRPLGWLITREHHGYTLQAAGMHVDVADLDLAEADGTSAPSPDRALAAVERALALWRGPSLADVRRLPLGELLAVGLDRRRETLIDTRLQLLLDVGRTAEVLAPLERLVREDPLNEARWAMLATALYRAGHPADALRTLDAARRALAAEAGLLPGPALRDLQQRILTHDVEPIPHRPHLGAPPPIAALPAALISQAPSVLYGREAQLEALGHALDDLSAGGRSMVLRLTGEPGAGKSALAACFARTANERGIQVLHGWAEKEATQPLGLLNGPVADLVANAPNLRDSARRVLGALLGWSDLQPSEAQPDSAAATNDRARVFDAVRRILTASAEPVLVILDDAQWADELSCAIIRSIARFPVDAALLLVVLERATNDSRVAGRGVTDIVVGPLSRPDLARWTGRPAANEWIDELAGLTGGLPLLVQEVLRRLQAGAALGDVRASMSRHMLRDRAAQLSRRASEVLFVAAVLGEVFSFDDVLAVSDIGELELVEDLDAAVTEGILKYDVSDPDVFRFAHDLLRLGILDTVTPLRRMRMHAHVLDKTRNLPTLAAAHHARAAGRFIAAQRLAELCLVAATDLLAAYGFEDARILITSALTAISGQPASGLRARLLSQLAQAEAALGSPHRARDHLHEAIGVAKQAADSEAAARAILMVESLFGHEEAMEPDTPGRLEELLAQLPDTAVDARFMVLRQLIYTHLSAGHLSDASLATTKAISLAKHIGTSAAESALVHLQFFQAAFAGDTDARRRLIARAGELGATAADPRFRIRHLSMSVVHHLHEGAAAEAERCAVELATSGAATGDPYNEWLGLAASFTPPLLAMDLSGARGAAERAFARGSASDLFGVQSAYTGQMFTLGWVTGNLPTVQPPSEVPELQGPQLAWRAARALALTLAGNPSAAEVELARLVADITACGSHWIGFSGVALAVEAAAAIGFPDVLRTAEPILRRRVADHVVVGTGILDLGPVSRYLALTLAGTGHQKEAAELLTNVHEDPRSGRLWQLRAAYDLLRLGADRSTVTGGSEISAGEPWSWLLKTAAPSR